MSDYGIKISLPGFDVKTATPEQCVLHSGFDTFKVKRAATPAHFGVVQLFFATEPTNGTTTNIFEMEHGYDYRPSCMVHMDDGTLVGIDGKIELDAFAETYFLCYVTDTEFKIDFVKGTTAPPVMLGDTYTFRYYVFSEDGD